MKMIPLLSLLAALLVSGCATKKIARYDAFDNVRIEQMSGNVISGRVFGKTALSLNARRETRQINSVTNVSVTLLTNVAVISVTNQLITTTTNLITGASTNLTSPPPIPVPAPTATNAPAAGDTPATPVAPAEGGEAAPVITLVAPPPPSSSTNITVTLASNASQTRGANQTSGNIQLGRNVNTQITSTSNSVSITTQHNVNVVTETNYTISYLTNTTLTPVTNVSVLHTNLLQRDYFLFTELFAPSDFVPLSSGESLVILVDGERYGFTSSTSQAHFVGRRGWTSTLYRATPEALVAIANAQDVQIQIRGVGQVIQRDLPKGAQLELKEFLLEYFTPEAPQPESPQPPESDLKMRNQTASLSPP